MKTLRKIAGYLALIFAVMLVLQLFLEVDITEAIKRGLNLHSKSEISAELKKSMQEEFNTNDDFCWYGIKVTNVSITKIEGNQYKAFVDIEYMGGKKKMVGADVWVNSSHYHYEFPAGTFLFLMFE